MTIFIYPKHFYGGRITVYVIDAEGKVLSKKNCSAARFVYSDMRKEEESLRARGYEVEWVDEDTPAFQEAKKKFEAS